MVIHSRMKRSDSKGMARSSFLITAHALAPTHKYSQLLIPYDLVKSSDSAYLGLSTIIIRCSCWMLVLVGLIPHILRWEMVPDAQLVVLSPSGYRSTVCDCY